MAASEFAVAWDPRFLEYDFGPTHPFTERSRSLAVDLLGCFQGDGAVTSLDRFEPLADLELERFHRREYVDRVERLSRRGRREPLDAGDTPSFPGCHDASARLARGTLDATAWALERPFRRAFQPGGGLHHAHPDRASGFCIYNDVALALRYALDGPPRRQRVAYLDIDAHHGDGVMYGFYDDGRVLDIDFHQDGRTIFPGTGALSETGRGDGAGTKVNVPLPPGAGDEAFRPLFRRIVPSLLRSFRPELIVLQHGVDGHAGDGLAALQLTEASYREAVGTTLDAASELGGVPLVVTGGGGYTPENVTRTLARTGLQLMGRPSPAAEAGLPATWRRRYRDQLALEAPTTFGDIEPGNRSPWSIERTDAMMRQLESALGRSLGRAAGEAGSNP
ncbi:MAG: acetoin utilization protein AcuC [Thermoplasmata archaeon]|nr:acetoin utilization protein AcuC [Thermoplasmata archaeon]